MVEQSYAEEPPQGECAEDSAVTARDRSAFAIFTSLEHADEFSGFMRLRKLFVFYYVRPPVLESTRFSSGS